MVLHDGNLPGKIPDTYGFYALYVRCKSATRPLLMRGTKEQERIYSDHGHWMMKMGLGCF
jgi:hypothetical protein